MTRSDRPVRRRASSVRSHLAPLLAAILSSVALFASGTYAAAADARADDDSPAAADATGATGATDDASFDRTLYAALLERHTLETDDVVGTRVDYRALREDPDWPRLVAQLRAARPSQLDRQGRLAFWIDAYNILTLDLVLDHYPVDSIRDIGSFLFPVWNREVATIEGRSLSLGAIEHEILRPMGEPRIHAAIVCASTSCPPLARRPYRPERLDADLDEAMRRWLSSEAKGVSIDRQAGRIRVSAIFDWFEADFEASGGVLETIARYVDSDTAAWLRGPGRSARIRYLDYDWTLNDARR